MFWFVALLVLSDVPSAEAARREALTRYGLGLLRAHNDRPIEALKHFEAAAKSDPASPEPLKPLVSLYADLGRDAAAIRTAKKVLELDPTDAETAHTLGKLYFDAKRYADAVAVLKQAAESPRLAKEPRKRYGVLRDVARAAELANDWASAEAALTDAAKLAPEDRDRAEVREKLGRVLTERKRYAEAVAAYAEARSLFEKVNDRSAAARIHWNLSGVLSAEGKLDDAMAHLSKFLALKPSGAAPYERLADLLRRAGHGNRIPATLAKLGDENLSNEAIAWVLAAELGRTNPDAAERKFRDLAERTSDPAFFAMLVRFHKDAGRMRGLLDLSDKLFKTARGLKDGDEPPKDFVAKPADVDRARAFANAVKAEAGLSDRLLPQAAQEARTGVKRLRDTWELVEGLAERDGQLAVAEAALRQTPRTASDFRLLEILLKQQKWAELRDTAVGMSQSGAAIYYAPLAYLATAQAELGDTRGALESISKLEKAGDANDGWVRSRKVYVLNILGKHEAAVAECLDTLPKVARNPSAVRQLRIALSNSYLGVKKFREAEAILRQQLEDDADDALVLNNLGYHLADEGRKLEEAEQLIRRAIELEADERRRAGNPEGESGTYLDSLGWVLFRRGKVAEAREVLEKVAKMPDTVGDATVWDHLGDVRFRSGATGAAREAWTKAAELYANSHQGKQGGRLKEVERKLEQSK